MSAAAKRAGISVEIPSGPEESELASLHAAVAQQNLNAVRAVLATQGGQALPLEMRDAWERTPLVVAAKRGDATILAYLLAKGADPTVEASFGVTPAGWAAHNAHFADALKEAYVGHPLSWAIRNNHFQTARILMSLPATHEAFLDDTVETNAFGESVLHACVRSKNARLLNMVLAFGTWPINEFNKAGMTPEQLAAVTGLKRIFEQAKAWDEAEPAASVHAALESADFGVLRATLDAGLDINAVNETGETPLIAAAKAGMGTIVAYLLYRGADVAPKDALGNTALHAACFHDHFETARILLANPAVHAAFAADDPDGTYAGTVNGETVLHMAARSDNVDLVRLVLAFENFASNLEAQNNQKQAPKDVASEPDVRVSLKEAAKAVSSGVLEPSLLSPIPLTPRTDSRVCAVCLLPPEPTVSSVMYTCSCLAMMCHRCLGQTVADGIQSTDGFPCCINTMCGQRIPLHILSDTLPPSRQLELIAIVVNEQVRKTAEATDAQGGDAPASLTLTCRACSRANIISDPFASNQGAGATSRYVCDHCGVNLCAVCNNIFPPTSIDSQIHEACQVQFPYIVQFQKLQETIANAVFPTCPDCGAKPTASPGSVAPTDITTTCACGVTYSTLTGAAVQPDALPAPASLEDLAALDPSFTPEYIAAVRARAAILAQANAMGTAHFVEMVDRFKWHDSINGMYFSGAFPFDESFLGYSPNSLPSWLAFEPSSLWPLWQTWAPQWNFPIPDIPPSFSLVDMDDDDDDAAAAAADDA